MKYLNRFILLALLILIPFSSIGCSSMKEYQTKKDAKAYMEMKGLISEALEEYYAMLERPRYMVAEDIQDDSETSNHNYFYNKLNEAKRIADTIQSEEFSELILMNRKSIISVREAYMRYSMFCEAMDLYSKDKSIYYDPGFQKTYKNCYADYQAYNQLFDEYYGKAQTVEDYLNDEGVFEGLHWDSEED